MKEKFRDLKKLPTDGYLIFPLSMSRLQNSQNPKECLKQIEAMDEKVTIPGIDIIFLYTNGLYFNSEEESFSLRKKTNAQMLAHRNELKKLIMTREKIPKYIPSAFHFLPFDYIILNSDEFQRYFETLKRKFNENKIFREKVYDALGNRQKSESNVNFILEETAISHLIRQKQIEFPKTLVKEDKFRLIIYPGKYLEIDYYVWKNKILPMKRNINEINPFYDSIYNPLKKELYKFREIRS